MPKHFFNLMQLYMASHSLHNSKHRKLKDSIYAHYSMFGNMYNNSTLGTIYQDDMKKVLGSTLIKQCFLAGAKKAWDIGGILAGMRSNEVSEMLHDDNVVRACFAAQIAWIHEDNESDREYVALSIMSGTLHSNLLLTTWPFVADVINMLKSCQQYRFNGGFWGFDEGVHIAHISYPSTYSMLVRYYDVFSPSSTSRIEQFRVITI